MKPHLRTVLARAALAAGTAIAMVVASCIYPTDGYREAGRHLDLPPPPEQAADSSSDDSGDDSGDDSSDAGLQEEEAASPVDAAGG